MVSPAGGGGTASNIALKSFGPGKSAVLPHPFFAENSRRNQVLRPEFDARRKGAFVPGGGGSPDAAPYTCFDCCDLRDCPRSVADMGHSRPQAGRSPDPDRRGIREQGDPSAIRIAG